MSAVFLPPENAADEKALDQEYAETNVWRYMFGFSFVTTAIGFFGFLFFVRTDSPKFYITKKREEEAIEAIKTIYNTEGSQI
jgi:hypothetical protein